MGHGRSVIESPLSESRVIDTRSSRAALAVILSMALAACASTSHRTPSLPDSPAAPTRSDSPNSSVTHPPQEPRAIMVDYALSMLGQPYRFGGAAPGGFDCSGLVVYAAHGAGVSVPRTAREQLSTGMPVARGQLQTGDLVFMHLAHKELHVGIAIDSERFIHAPSRGGYVRIDSLAAPPYARSFLSARRIIVAH
jgi:cell wall-associated NlpC family hydrolase